MKLSEVFKPEHIVVPLRAGTVREATEQLALRVVQAGAVADGDRLLDVIRKAWPEDMVTVGEHAFLPHFRTDAVPGIVAALGVSPVPIRWEKDRHRAARVVILVLAPPREAPTYLQVIGALARAMADPANVLALLAAQTPAAVLAVPALEGVEVGGHLTVRDMMTAQVVTCRPDQTLGEVARLMVERDVRAVPVVNEAGTLLGMVTHRELLRHLLPDYLQRTKSGEVKAPTRTQIQRASTDPRDIPVKEAMARTVLCVSEDQTLSDVASLMNNKDVDRFPVVREGVVVGFLTRADMIRRLVTL
ncbi:MAG TPA: CBS domain-containing protein [Gemmatimonadales bacterium]